GSAGVSPLVAALHSCPPPPRATIPSHRTACVLSPLPCPSQSHTPPNLPHRRSSQSRRRCLLRPETTAAGTPTPSPAFYLPQLVLSPVDLEEPPFARHRGRAAATTRGPPPTGAPSFSTMRHQQRRTTPPSTPSHDVQPLTPPETVARIGQMCSSTGSPPKVASSSSSGSSSSPDLMRVRVLVVVCRQLKEGAGHGDAAGAASSTHTHRRPSEGTSLLGLANYADEEEDEHGGPRGRANGRPREKEEEDERRALERQPMQVELRRDCSYLDTVNRLRPLEKRQFGVFRDCMYGGIEGVPLHANCRRMAKLQLIGRLTTWLSKQQNQFSGGLGSTSLLIEVINAD
uniref:Uncharacterized protein n=2 Tax=Aegilops tauschii subsp. strangulata TaxID=200361 RepID=A0A453P266_AEGTS